MNVYDPLNQCGFGAPATDRPATHNGNAKTKLRCAFYRDATNAAA